EIAVACLLIAAVAWTGTLLHAMGAWSATRRWVVSLAGALVLAAYALFIADFDYVAERWRAVLLVAAAVFWLVAVPAFAGPRQNAVERMRRIDGRILLRVIGAGLYGIALFAGLALALRAIDVLFELDLRSGIYGHVWGGISFALVPWVVLGGLRDCVRPVAQGGAARAPAASGRAAAAHACRGSAWADCAPTRGRSIREAPWPASRSGSRSSPSRRCLPCTTSSCTRTSHGSSSPRKYRRTSFRRSCWPQAALRRSGCCCSIRGRPRAASGAGCALRQRCFSRSHHSVPGPCCCVPASTASRSSA